MAHSVLGAVEEGGEDSPGALPGWQKEQVEIARASRDDSGERFVAAPDRLDFHEYRHIERFAGKAARCAVWRRPV